jgi:putative selenium metabolism protein SsnA
MTLRLTGGTIVRSLRPPVVETGDLAIHTGRIAADGSVRAGSQRLDCTGCVIVAGNVCAHTHLYSSLARGMPYRLAPPRSFLEILQRVWWRLDRALDPATIRASALAGGMEALLAGTTTLIDHHASPAAVDGSLDIIAGALAELGIRSVLCYETSDRDGPSIARAGLDENGRFLASVEGGDHPLARGMVGAHASFTLSDETLAACAELARDRGVGVHIHAAEDAIDEHDAERRCGVRVAARLADAGALDRRSLLAHGVHLRADEIDTIKAAGATVVHNPRSNLNNAVGRAPLAALGGCVALGTDGIDGDMFEEARAAYFLGRAEDHRAGMACTLDRLVEGARVAGEAFGEPLLGRLEAGAPADLVVLRYPGVTPLDATTLAAHWLFGMRSGAVRDVIVGGELVVRDGRPVRVDANATAAEARDGAVRLWRRLDEIDVHLFQPVGAR